MVRMSGQKNKADPNARERNQKQRGRRSMVRKIGAFAVLVAVALVASACDPENHDQRNAATPVDEQPPPAGTLSSGFFLDLETGERTPLAESIGPGFSYVPSPDGTKLAYNTCCSYADVMTVVNVDGTNARTLQAPEGLNYYGARWSPDGTKLVYQERNGGGDNSHTGDVGNLFVEDLATGRKTQVTDLELSRASWWFLSPSFSPDGQKVIFHLPRSKSQTTKWDVWSVPVTGGEPRLVQRNASFPMVRPEGPDRLRIQFVSPRAKDFAGTSIMTGRLFHPALRSWYRGPESARQTLVKADDSISFPTMSPDGTKIAYQDGGAIYVFHFGTHPREASRAVASGGTAEWLDDDTLIVSP